MAAANLGEQVPQSLQRDLDGVGFGCWPRAALAASTQSVWIMIFLEQDCCKPVSHLKLQLLDLLDFTAVMTTQTIECAQGSVK